MASSNSIDESAGGGVPSGETPIGLDRLRRFFAYMFARHDSGEQVRSI